MTQASTTSIGSTVNMVWQAYDWSSDSTTYKTRAVLAFERIAPTPAGQWSFDNYQFDTNMIGRIGGTRDNPTGPLTMYFVKNTAPRSNGPVTCDVGYTPVVRVTVGQSDIQYACMPAFKMAGGFNQSLANGHATGGEIDQYTGNLYIRIAWNGGAAVDNQSSTSTAASSESEWTFGIWDPITGKYSMSGSVQPGDWYQGMATVPQERVKVRQNVSGSGSGTPGAPCDIALDADGNAYTYSGSGLSATSAGNMSLVRMEPARDADGNIVDGTAANPWRYYVVEKINKDPANLNSWWSSGSNIWGNAFINGQFLLGGGTGIYNKPAAMPQSAYDGGPWSGTTRMVKIDPLTGLARVIWSIQNDQLSPYTSRDNMSPEQAQIIRGVIYNDANGDGKIDNGEVGIPNQTVALYAQQEDGTAKLMLSSQTTDSTGQYSFIVSGSATQTYYVRPVQVQAPVLGGAMVNAIQTWGAGSDEVGYNSAGQQVHNVATVKCQSGDITSENGGACNGALPMGSPDPTPGALGSTSDPSTWASYATVVFATSQQVPSADFGFSAFGSYGDAAAGPVDANVPAHINGTAAPQVFLGNTLGAYPGPATDNQAHNATDDGVFVNSGIAPFPLTDATLAASVQYPMVASVSGSQAANAYVTGWTTGAGNNTWNTTPTWNTTVFGGTTGTTATGNYQYQPSVTPSISGSQPVQMRVNASLTNITQPTNAGGEYYGVSGSSAWTTPGEIEDYLLNVADSVYRPAAQTTGGMGTFSFGMTGSSWTTSITAGQDKVVVSPQAAAVTTGTVATMTATVPNANWSVQNVKLVNTLTNTVIQDNVPLTAVSTTVTSWPYTPDLGTDVTAVVTFAPTPVIGPDRSRLDVDKTSTPVGTNITATATVKDADNNPIKGSTVTFSGDKAELALSAPTCVTGDDGTCSITVTSQKIGDYQLSAKIDINGTATDLYNSPVTLTFTNATLDHAYFAIDPVVDPNDANHTNWASVDDPSNPAGTRTYYTGTLTALDTYDNPVTDLTAARVQFTASSPNVTVSAMTNNGDGTYSVKYSSNVADSTYTASVSVDAAAVQNQAKTTDKLPIPFLYGQPNPGPCEDPTHTGREGTSLSADPLDPVIPAPSLATAYITDRYCNPVPGVDVTFNSDGSAKLNTSNPPQIVTTDATGHASVAVRDDTPEAVHVSATIAYQGDPAVEINNSPVTITFQHGGPSDRESSVSVEPTTQVVGALVRVTVTVRDDQRTPIPGIPISEIQVTGSKGSGPNDSATVTNCVEVGPSAPGVYTCDMTAQLVGTYTVSATVEGVHILQQPTVTFTHGDVCVSHCTPIESPDYVTHFEMIANDKLANGRDQDQARAWAYDTYGNVVPDAPVVATDETTGDLANILNPRVATATTGDDGTAVISWTATQPGTYTAQGTIGGLNPTATGGTGVLNQIRFSAGNVSAQNSSLEITPASPIVAGQTYTLKATARDADAHPLAGVTVSFSVNSADATLNANTCYTISDGTCSVGLTSTKAGQYTVHATVPQNGVATDVGGNGDPTKASPQTVAFTNDVLCVGDPGCQTHVTIDPNNATADGTSQDKVNFFGFDKYGNTVPGAQLSVSATGPVQAVGSTTPTTDAQGTASVGFTSTTAGSYPVTVTADGRQVPVTANLNFTAGQGGVGKLSIDSTDSKPVGSSFTVTATMDDTNNNPVSGYVVSFPAVPNLTFSASSCITGADGTCKVDITSTVAGTYTISATNFGNTVQAVFTAGPVCATTSTAQVTRNGALADGTDTDIVAVHAADCYNNPVSDATVASTTTSANLTIQSPIGNTGADGNTSIWYTSHQDGSYQANVTVTNVVQGTSTTVTPQGSPVTLMFAPQHVSPLYSSWTVTPAGPLVVGQDAANSYTLTATLKDDNNHPVPGGVITFKMDPTGPTFPNGASCSADATGTCTVTVWSTKSGTYSITGLSGDTAILSANGRTAESVVWNPDEVCAELSGCTHEPLRPGESDHITRVVVTTDNAIADGDAHDIATVYAYDKWGNPVPAMLVLSTSQSGDDLKVQQGISPTGDDGTSTIWYTSTQTKVGGYQADVTVGGKLPTAYNYNPANPAAPIATNSNVITLNFGPGPVVPGNSTFTVEPKTLKIGEQATATAILRDKNNNVVSNASVTFSATGSVVFAKPSGAGRDIEVSNDQGTATTTLTDNTPETATVTATVPIGGVDVSLGSVDVTFTNTGPVTHCEDPNLNCSKLIVDNDTPTVGNTVNATAYITDKDANPLAGVDVTFTIDSGTSAVLTTTSGTTDASGNAHATLTDTKAEPVVLHAKIAEGEIDKSPQTVTFQAGKVNPHNTDVTVNPTTQVAGSPVVVTIVARDDYMNPVPGIPASEITVTGVSQTNPADTATVTPCAEVGPSAPGTYTCQLTAEKVGDYKVTATVTDVEADQHPIVTITNAGVDVKNSYFEMITNDQLADGQAQDVAKAHALDHYFNAVPNAKVVAVDKTTGDLAGVLKPATAEATTGADGTALVSWTATKAGTYTAEGTIDGLRPVTGILNQIRFVPTLPSLTESKLVVTPDGAIQVGNSYTLTATVRDSNKNIIPDYTVSFSVSDPTNATLSDTSCQTLSTGQCSVTLTSTVKGTYTAHATLPGPSGPGDISGSPVQLQFLAGPPCFGPTCLMPTHVTVDPNGVQADGTQQDVINAFVYDAYGNTVPGAELAATASTPAGATLATPANPKTDDNGTAILGYTATTAGTYSVPVTINGQTPQGSPAQLSFTSSAASKGTLTIDPKSAQVVGSSFKVTAKVTDKNDNAVSGAVATFPAVDNLTFDNTSCTTGADGTCSVNVTSTVVGTYTISATSPGLTFNTVPAEFTPGPVCVPGDPGAQTTGNVTRVEEVLNGVYPDGVQHDIFRVYAYDCDGNAVPGATVASTAADPTGSSVTVQSDIAPTAADGTSTIWYSSNTGGTFKFNVTVDSKTPQGSPVNVIFGGIADPKHSSWTVTPDGPLVVGTGADNTYTLTAALHDANDKPVQNAAMSFVINPSGPWFPNGATCLSAADGTCSVQVYSTKSGTYSITATTAGQPVNSAAGNPAESRAWKADAVCTTGDGCLTNVKVTQDGVRANGDERDIATLSAYDKYGNPVPGALVQSVTTDANLRIQEGIKGTDDNGVSTIWYSSLKSGPHDATVSVDGMAPRAYQLNGTENAPGHVTLTFVAADNGNPETSVLSISPKEPTTADTITVTAQINDANGNPVQGATVSFSTTGNATLSPLGSSAAGVAALTAVSGPDGKAEVTMIDHTAETVTLTATIPYNGKDTNITNSPMTVVIGPGPIQIDGKCAPDPTGTKECTNLSVDKPTLTVGELSTARAHLTDYYRNPVSGTTVNFTLDQPGSTGILVTTHAETDAQGNAFATVTDSVAESVKVHATITGLGEIYNSPQTVTFQPLRSTTAPVITVPKDNTLTNQNPLQIAGTGTEGATVKVTDTDGTVVCTTTVGSGVPAPWNCTAPLADGDHVLTATQTTDGVTSGPSNAVHVTIDTVPPAPPVVNVANATTVSGTAEPNSIVTITWPDGTVTGNIPVDANGNWTTSTPKGMESGNISVTATDKAGNVSQPTIAYLDTKIPAAPVIEIANKTEISGTADKPGKVIITYPKQDGTTGTIETPINPDMSWSIPTPPDATDGTVHAVVVDNAGNVSPEATHPLDVTPPAAPVVGPSNGTLIYGTAEAGGTMHITDMNGTPIPGCENVTVDKDSKFSCQPNPRLPVGTQVKISVSDAAGNVSPTVVITIQPLTIDFGKPNVAPGDTQTVTGSNFNPGESVTLTVDGQPVGPAQKVDENGQLTFTFVVPVNSKAGSHTATLTGPQSGTVSGTYNVVINAQIKTGGTAMPAQSFPIGLLISGSIMVLAGLWISPKVRRRFKAGTRS
ncbi:MAG: Ig-like domain-containing protein [Propionibacteriaceae bacterium]|nr:Ig-like domain-containing protein [Propionibacteriaceae bacterium]